MSVISPLKGVKPEVTIQKSNKRKKKIIKMAALCSFFILLLILTFSVVSLAIDVDNLQYNMKRNSFRKD